MKPLAAISLAYKRSRCRKAQRLLSGGRAAAGFRSLAALARGGYAPAQLAVAHSYLHGAPVPRSVESGLMWLERAADGGEVEAQVLLAGFSLYGSSRLSAGEIDLDAFRYGEVAQEHIRNALHWAGKAAAAGSAEGAALLSCLMLKNDDTGAKAGAAEALARSSAETGCLRGILVLAALLLRKLDEPSRREAETLLERAAQSGNPMGCFLLALAIQGSEAEHRAAAAVVLLEQAAQQGLSAAQLKLGQALLTGVGIPRDESAAVTWLRRAASGGEAQAAFLIGELSNRKDHAGFNATEAARWYEIAAGMRHGLAARRLANLYCGEGDLGPDPTSAAHWLLRAIELGDGLAADELSVLIARRAVDENIVRPFRKGWAARAELSPPDAFALGICLAHGIGGRADKEGARHWLEHAAQSGRAAQYALGRMLAAGHGLDKDETVARAWLDKAARAGDMDATALLAEMHLNGRGGERSVPLAIQLFEQAGRAGHPGSLFALGAINAGGYGYPPDPARAADYLRRAAACGHPSATLALST